MKSVDDILNKVGIDKVLHCVISYALVLTLGHFLPIILTAIIVLVIGALKEILDMSSSGFSTDDLLADTTGCLLGLGVLYL